MISAFHIPTTCRHPEWRGAILRHSSARARISVPYFTRPRGFLLSAVFPSARDRMTFPELLAEGLEPHKVGEIFLYGAQEPDVWVDISASLETKLAALKAHTSQMGDWDPTEMIQTWSRDTAARHPDKPDGFGEYAESFKYFKLE